MRPLPPAAGSYLERRNLLLAHLFEFDIDGTTYRFTDFGANLAGVSPASTGTFTAIAITRDVIRCADGLQIDDLEVNVAHGGGGDFGGKTWVAISLTDAFSESPVRCYLAYVDPVTETVVACFLRFAGKISTAEPSSTNLRIVVAVGSNEFSRPFPAVVYSVNCVWNFADSGCAFPDDFEWNVTVGNQSTANVLHIDALPGGHTQNPPADGAHLFFMGTVVMDGNTRTIIDAAAAGDGGVGEEITSGFGFKVSPAFPTLTLGSTAKLKMGCNKAANVCELWHNNLVHFMGTPLAPKGA